MDLEKYLQNREKTFAITFGEETPFIRSTSRIENVIYFNNETLKMALKMQKNKIFAEIQESGFLISCDKPSEYANGYNTAKYEILSMIENYN